VPRSGGQRGKVPRSMMAKKGEKIRQNRTASLKTTYASLNRGPKGPPSNEVGVQMGKQRKKGRDPGDLDFLGHESKSVFGERSRPTHKYQQN